MKKVIFALLFVTSLISSHLKGMDSLCVKNHGSSILNDQKWHTLKFESRLNEDIKDNNSHISNISIRQKNVTGDYEFKSNKEVSMLEFYDWLTADVNLDQISIEKTCSGYDGSFYCSTFVPLIDHIKSFIGIES